MSNMPEGMQCSCAGEMEISGTEKLLAQRLGVDATDVHMFLDEWARAAKDEAQRKQEERPAAYAYADKTLCQSCGEDASRSVLGSFVMEIPTLHRGMPLQCSQCKAPLFGEVES